MGNGNIRWNEQKYAAVDVESNGQSPPEMVEISLVLMEGELIQLQQAWLIRPTLPVLERVSRIHGITNAHLATSPRIQEISSELTNLISGRYLAAHNAHIDWEMAHRQVSAVAPLGIIDTLRLARRFFPGLSSYKLTALIDHFGIKLDEVGDFSSPHRAAYDASATTSLFLYLMRYRSTPLLMDDYLWHPEESIKTKSNQVSQLTLFKEDSKP